MLVIKFITKNHEANNASLILFATFTVFCLNFLEHCIQYIRWMLFVERYWLNTVRRSVLARYWPLWLSSIRWFRSFECDSEFWREFSTPCARKNGLRWNGFGGLNTETLSLRFSPALSVTEKGWFCILWKFYENCFKSYFRRTAHINRATGSQCQWNASRTGFRPVRWESQVNNRRKCSQQSVSVWSLVWATASLVAGPAPPLTLLFTHYHSYNHPHQYSHHYWVLLSE